MPTTANTSIEIMPATQKDMKVVQNMIRSSAHMYEDFVDSGDLNEHYVDDSWAEKNFKKREFYIGYKDGKPFGTLSFQVLKDRVAYLGYIYLDLKFVGKGLGKGLMNFAQERARTKKLENIALIAHPKAHWAIRAYEKFGFKKVASSREAVLKWNEGALKPYYEEGFALYMKPLA